MIRYDRKGLERTFKGWLDNTASKIKIKTNGLTLIDEAEILVLFHAAYNLGVRDQKNNVVEVDVAPPNPPALKSIPRTKPKIEKSARIYHSMLVREHEYDKWRIHFGDYDLAVVQAEVEEYKYVNNCHPSLVKIIATAETQAAIDEQVQLLNSKFMIRWVAYKVFEGNNLYLHQSFGFTAEIGDAGGYEHKDESLHDQGVPLKWMEVYI